MEFATREDRRKRGAENYVFLRLPGTYKLELQFKSFGHGPNAPLLCYFTELYHEDRKWKLCLWPTRTGKGNVYVPTGSRDKDFHDIEDHTFWKCTIFPDAEGMPVWQTAVNDII